MATYSEVKADKEQAGYGHESNKCVLIALAIVADCGYEVARSAVHLHTPTGNVSAGRGYYGHHYRPAYKWLLSSVGKTMTHLDLSTVRIHAKTVRSFTPRVARALGCKDGFIEVRGHIIAVKNYKVEDWSEEKVKRITGVTIVK